MKGKLFIVSGPSGSGKSTVTKLVKDRLNIPLSISATTRQPRDGEIDGKDYFFLTKETFEQKIKNDEFYEYANVHGNYYGTLKEVVESNLNKGLNVNTPYNEDGLCPLVLSCYNNNTTIPELLLKNKANVNGVGNLGGDVTYPLIIAIENGNENLVKLLLEYGAKTNITDNIGNTPIELAREKGLNRILKLLVQSKH